MDNYPSPMPIRRPRRSLWWLATLSVALVVAALLLAEHLARTGMVGAQFVAGITAATSGDWIAYRVSTEGSSESLYAMHRPSGRKELVHTSAEIPDMALSPDGSRLIFLASDGSGSRAYIYDTTSGSEPQLCSPAALLAERVPETEPAAVDWLSDGRAVIECVGPAEIALFAYSPGDGHVDVLARGLTSEPTRLFCPHLAAKPRVYLQPDYDPMAPVTYLDEGTQTVVPAMSPEVPGWGLVSPDGTRVLVNAGAGYVIVPTAEAGPGPEVPVDASPNRVCADWSPSGTLVAVGADIVSATDGRRQTTLTALPDPDDVWFSGDDHLIALEGGRLLLVEIASGRSTTLVASRSGGGGLPSAARNLRRWLSMF
jgi:hypothetical protein